MQVTVSYIGYGYKRVLCFVTFYIFNVFISPQEGCEILRSLCLSVGLWICVSARISRKTYTQTSQNFLYMLPMWPWFGHLLITMQRIVYFRFCG